MQLKDGKMRVVQLGPVPPPYGGVSANMLAIHERLVEVGHESWIIDLTNKRARSEHPCVIKPRSTMGLITRLASMPVDIVHYHIGGVFTPRLAALTFLCGFLPRRRSVVTFHSGGFALNASSNAKPYSLRGAAFQSVDQLIGVNEQVLKMFRAYGIKNGKATLIPPFQLKRPSPGVILPDEIEGFIQRSRPLLLAVGGPEPEYQINLLVRMMPGFLQARSNAGLLVVGVERDDDSLNKLIEKFGLNGRVMLAGNLSPDLTLKIIEKATVLLRITQFDGDAISVREALFLGTPVVASDNAKRPCGVHLVNCNPSIENLTKTVIKACESQFSDHSAGREDFGNIDKVIQLYTGLLTK